MAWSKKVADHWDQKQREAKLKEKAARYGMKTELLELPPSTRDPYGRKVMRYVDLATGDYFDKDVDPVYPAPWETMEEAQKRVLAKLAREMQEKVDLQAAEDRRRWLEAEYPKQKVEETWPSPDKYSDKYYYQPVDLDKAAITSIVTGTPATPVHKTAHFPTKWIGEAIDRAEQSDKCITFAIEREGIVVTAMEAGEQFAVRVTGWTEMETCEVNPLLHAIEDCERKLDVLQNLKAKVRGH